MSKVEIWKQTTRSLVAEFSKERGLATDQKILLERFILFGERKLAGLDKIGKKKEEVAA